MRLIFDSDAALEAVEEAFEARNIKLLQIDERPYPYETIFIVYVEPSEFRNAVRVGNEVDSLLSGQGFDGFVSVREGTAELVPSPIQNLSDSRITEVMNLLVARSRASEMHPSLSYVPDVSQNLEVVQSRRHHLVFGRRGAGKTALLVEAKKQLGETGTPTAWLNLQVYRWEEIARVFAQILKQTAGELQRYLSLHDDSGELGVALEDLVKAAGTVASTESPDLRSAQRLVPMANTALRMFSGQMSVPVYVFLDDFHYVARGAQPQLLELLHAVTRDTVVLLKVASIRNLTRWYSPSENLGLQTVHDADTIDLDLNLNDPSRAEDFLEEVLSRFAEHVGIKSLSRVFNKRALDRLVLASGGVPRDYLTLAAASIRLARGHDRKRVGVQDINAAAGDAAQTKIDELNEDLAGAGELSNRAQTALKVLRDYCLDKKRTTFFRVDAKGKEEHEQSYEALAALLDLRLVHLIEPSLSDAHKAGERYEVFMLDLSQFSGQRLKRSIRTLDFKDGVLVRHETGKPDTVGNSSRQLNTILRSAPVLDLQIIPAGIS